MFSPKEVLARRTVAWSVAVLLLLCWLSVRASAGQFEASVAPKGRYLVKVYPNIFFTSAYFGEGGKAQSMCDVTGLFYLEVPVHVQYGILGSLSAGAIVPLGWAVQEDGDRSEPVGRFTVREFWVTAQHRWLSFPIISSSALHLKIPLAGKEDWEDGLRIGDNQIDLYPAYHFDYFSSSMYWYVQSSVGYKFRFKNDDYKPYDEFKFYAKCGYELFRDLQMRFFLYADLVDFRNGDRPGENREFFEHDGSLQTYGYGVSFWPRPTFRMEFSTGGDWAGRNRYRGITWVVGLTKIF